MRTYMQELIQSIAVAEDFCKQYGVHGWNKLRGHRRMLSKKGYVEVVDMFMLRDIKEELNLPESLELSKLLAEYFA